MRAPLIALCFLALALAWLVFFGAGTRPADWDAALLFIGATAFFYWMFRSGQIPPRMPRWHVLALWALPVYAVVQLLPLSAGWLETLSPARLLISESLLRIFPNAESAPLAVAPAAAAWGLAGLLGALTVFSLLRDLEWRLAVIRPWLTAAPLIAIAGLEAFIGVGQWLSGSPHVPVRGTLASAEQFAALLELALPFAVVFGYISFRRHQRQGAGYALPAVWAAASWLAALAILAALFHTTSQASHVVVSASLYTVVALTLIPRLKTVRLRLIGAGIAAILAGLSLVSIVSPTDIAGSLAQLGANDQETADARSVLWSNAASLWGEYRWLGTGLGGFESTFLKYQGSTDLNRLQQPHNDLLALLIAFGVVGACLVFIAVIGFLRPTILGAVFQPDESRRLLAVAITAAACGLIVRSSFQAGISLPAAAMAFAWVAGMGQSSGLD